jgi:hypothetical protein
MALSEADMVAKIKAAAAAAGVTIQDPNFLLILCKGIVDEIKANATITGTVTGGLGAGGAVTGTIS